MSHGKEPAFLKVPCPDCGAEAGKPCRKKGGKHLPKWSVHSRRWLLWDGDRWKKWSNNA